MIDAADAVVALPGGSGTYEELLEVISLKRLGLFFGPVVLVNTRGSFGPLVAALEHAIAERFMDERHRAIWTVVEGPAEAIAAIADAPPGTPKPAASPRCDAPRHPAFGRPGRCVCSARLEAPT